MNIKNCLITRDCLTQPIKLFELLNYSRLDEKNRISVDMLISSPFQFSKCPSVLDKSINLVLIWDKDHLLIKVIPRFSPSEQKTQTPIHNIVHFHNNSLSIIF